MDLLDDIFSEPSAVKAPARPKFQPKAKSGPKKGPCSTGLTRAAKNSDLPNTSSTETGRTEQTSLRGASNLSTEVQNVVGSANPGHSEFCLSETVGNENLSACASLELQNSKDVTSQPTTSDIPALDPSTVQADEDTSGFPSVTFASASPFRPCDAHGSVGGFQIDMEQADTVDLSFLESVDMPSEDHAPSGNRAVKFQPMPKSQGSRKSYSAEVRLDGDLCTDPATAQVDAVVPSDVDQMEAQDFPKETSDATAFPQDSLDGGAVSLDNRAMENGYGNLDGVNDEILFNSSSPANARSEPTTNSEENGNCHLEKETSKKKRQRNSKKVPSENDMESKKRRKEDKAPEEFTRQLRKKIPQTTRRKRSVDKSLLEAPEHELDLQRVPIRDLIIFAEYKERQAKKQAAEVQPPSTNERNEQEDHPYDEDGTYGSDRETGSFDNPSTSKVVKDTGYFNYQSFTERRQKRWSKPETELFYQGIQEFGSDFTMIQQRYFPDRTRHQVKLKYKKEEREHPMRIHDAMTTKAKDLSHYEVLIKRLQEQERAAQEKSEQSGDDNVIGSAGEEDEGQDGEFHETHEAAKTEQAGGVARNAGVNQEPDNTTRAESPPKTYDSEGEFDWDNYKSEL